VKFKVRDIVDSIEEEDLYKMQADLAKGGVYLKKIIDDKLKEVKNQKLGHCATCGQALEAKESTFTLLFGPEDFKKKASFCETDCLEYFLAGMKDVNLEVKKNGI